MTDVLVRSDRDTYTLSDKLRVNHHGWVEHHEDGAVRALTPPNVVDRVLIDVDPEEWVDDE
ncbi:hypothetical protein [Halobacterium litoreum]|uniref:Uncharacterized protein n=1 Tax=Halobacterium litoreum TaxID=2039234 RepID=A0ABD5NA74_9EURY|nr:hypothetical protein [Halobacterium litoreum]UHH14889.1 hypothetical protein LT972_14750 [Halobacterium litoreum]